MEASLQEKLLFLEDKVPGSSEPSAGANQYVQWLINCQFENILKFEIAVQILTTGENEGSIVNQLRVNIDKFLDENSSSSESQLEIAAVGIACLQLFAGHNWLGRPINQKFNNFLDNEMLDDETANFLLLDGESYSFNISRLPYLLVARVILVEYRKKLMSLQLLEWWELRCLYLHQQILEEMSRVLYSAFQTDIVPEKLKSAVCGDRKLQTLIDLEIGNFYLLYGEVASAHEAFRRGEETAQLQIEWTGALGKRTRFQQSSLAQLTVRVKRVETTNELSSFVTKDYFPKDLKIEDETLLNRVSFVNEDDNLIPDLNPVHQAILLSVFSYLERARPKDELLREELLPLLQCVLGYPKSWSFQISSLLKRSKLESEGKRTLERSMMQLQELVDSYGKSSASLEQRLYYFYVSRLPLEAQVQMTLADLLLSLGAVNSALDIYLRLQSWEKVIECYQLLELKQKAEEIVRQEMEKKATPKLWCLLGYCTNDVKCFEEAWLLSNGRSSRAQRDWAMHFYKRKEYEAAIPHFRKSLEVNSLQEGVWLRLAFSALQLEDWETAATAYRSYCNINTDSFEAWNNVAKCYIKLGQKARAWKALQEAVKCNFENWKVWDNLMVVSIDCGEFEEAVRCYHRMLDLKEKHVDVDVLRVLVTAVADKELDNYGNPAVRLGPSIIKLFGRLTSQVPNNAQVWLFYARLTSAVEGLNKPEAVFKAAQFLQKSLRSAVQDSGWEKEVSSSQEVLSIALEFLDTCLGSLGTESASKDLIQLANSARLSVKSSLSLLKRYYDNQVPADLQSSVQSAEERLEMLVSKLAAT